MKVVCIYNGYIETSHGSSDEQKHIKVGKSYDVINEEKDWGGIGLKIKNDIGEYHHYNIVRFKRLDELRVEKLKELGII